MESGKKGLTNQPRGRTLEIPMGRLLGSQLTWKAKFLLSADTHWKDFLEAVDGVGDSCDPVSKYNKNFERDEKIKSLKVSGI